MVSFEGIERGRCRNLDKATDVTQAFDGTIYVADSGLGGVIVFEQDGQYRLQLGRLAGSDGGDGFGSVDRVAVDPTGQLFVLDRSKQTVWLYSPEHKKLGSYSLRGMEAAADIAWHPNGLLVLMSTGKILVMNHEGVAFQTMQPINDNYLLRGTFEPDSISVDAAGTILVTWPRDGIIVRYAPDGAVTGVRGPKLWSGQDLVATDANGFTCAMNSKTAWITRFDPEGWMLNRFGGSESRDGGYFQRPSTMAISPDGQHLAVLDTRRVSVIRYDVQNVNNRPLIFGQEGKNDGQFDEPMAIAMDAAGRTYVTDVGAHRINVFDATGNFQFAFGFHQRGKNQEEINEPNLIAVSPDGSTAYIYDADRYFIQKFSVDHEAGSATFEGASGKRGSKNPGELRLPNGLAIDHVGLLYISDSSRKDLQVWDFRGNNGIPIFTLDVDDIGLKALDFLSLTPDGIAWITGASGVTGVRWYP